MEITIVQGIIAGIVISLPKGPAGFLVLNQTIIHGWKKGVIIAAGCAATTLLSSMIVLFPKFTFVKEFAFMCARGFSTVPWVVSIIFVILAIIVYRLKQDTVVELPTRVALRRSFKIFLATLLDPLTYTQTIGMFIGAPEILKILFGYSAKNVFEYGIIERVWFLIGVMTGTIGWYVFSTLGLMYFQNGLRNKISWINKIFAIVFLVSAIALLFL